MLFEINLFLRETDGISSYIIIIAQAVHFAVILEAMETDSPGVWVGDDVMELLGKLKEQNCNECHCYMI